MLVGLFEVLAGGFCLLVMAALTPRIWAGGPVGMVIAVIFWAIAIGALLFHRGGLNLLNR